MGLGSVLNIANSGLNVTQANLEVVARNIANADTAGYTRKTLQQESIENSGGGRGVSVGDVTREVDEFLLKQLRVERSQFAGAEVYKEYLARIDQLFGEPGAANGLDGIVNRFGQSLQDLIGSPDSYGSRASAVGDAEALAQKLRSLTGDVQDLRQLTEDSIGDAIDEINDILQQIVKINGQLSAVGSGALPADVLDERDQFIQQLGDLIDIQVVNGDRNAVTIRTAGGQSLLEGTAVNLAFDRQGNIDASSLYNTDAAQRGVGTVVLEGANGFSIDLIASGAFGNGRLAALIDLRDNVLTQTQDQLDDLAHGLALSFSDKQVDGTAAAVSGPETGFDLDLSGILSGNAITLNYTQGGMEQTVTFVRVEDATLLPLDNSVTAHPTDTVIGIDFSGGIPAAIAGINTTLTVDLGTTLTVTNLPGNVLRILDDGAGATSDVNSLGARITTTALQDDGAQLALFVDVTGTPPVYSGSLDNGGQKLGFAARITVNASVVANNELLVRYSSSPETPLGDQTRPLDLYDRFAVDDFTFSPDSGIGETNNPYAGSVISFTQRIVSFQTAQAERASREYDSQEIVASSLQDRYFSSVTVNVDSELSQLISLQNAFSANARVLQAANDLMQILLQL